MYLWADTYLCKIHCWYDICNQSQLCHLLYCKSWMFPSRPEFLADFTFGAKLNFVFAGLNSCSYTKSRTTLSVCTKKWIPPTNWDGDSELYSQHHLIQPLVIQLNHFIRPFPLDTLHWLPILKATLNSTPAEFNRKSSQIYAWIKWCWLHIPGPTSSCPDCAVLLSE